MYFEIVSASGGFRVHIRGGSNEIMFTSEVYTSKSSAQNAIRAVQEGAAGAKVEDAT